MKKYREKSLSFFLFGKVNPIKYAKYLNTVDSGEAGDEWIQVNICNVRSGIVNIGFILLIILSCKLYYSLFKFFLKHNDEFMVFTKFDYIIPLIAIAIVLVTVFIQFVRILHKFDKHILNI